MKGYVEKLLLGIDIFFCMVLFRDPDVTISSETGLALQRANPPLWAKILGWCLDHIQQGHCQLAIKNDILRAKTAIAYLEAKP
jgi:hypothetical protein